jgi:phosphoribosylformylglycinamidine synthase subunit PurL
VLADLPIKELGDEAPVYQRPFVETPRQPEISASDVPAPKDWNVAVLQLLGSPDLCSKRWIWEQYDHLILGNTVQRPGGDAAVVRVLEGPKGLAMTTDVTPRYCEADPFEGGKQAVAEAWRNLTAVGAKPLAVTDNLNFGNPERPEIMGQLVGCIRGIAEACNALDFPVVSGNVSLYNETNGRAILPTPTIGGVGLLDDFTRSVTLAFKAEGEQVLLIGGNRNTLGQSLYLRELLGREEGAPPRVDLALERRNGDFVRGLIRAGRITACHDISDGGLAIALAEMVIAGGQGARIEPQGAADQAHGWLFGEEQARYVITCRPQDAAAVLSEAAAAAIEITAIGQVGGDFLTVDGLIELSVADLSRAHEEWLPSYMAAQAA